MGYDYQAGMSYNAVKAYNEGKKPLSKWLPLVNKYFPGIKVNDIKEYFYNAEYHHTGKFYNKTIMITREELVNTLFDNRFDIREKIKNRNNKQEKVYYNCEVRYLEWSGTRKHPIATEIIEKNCIVSDLPNQFFEIKTSSGEVFRKKQDTRGFYAFDSEGFRIYKK